MARIDSDDDLFERGKRIANDPTLRGVTIGDPPRPVTNLEMLAVSHYRRTIEMRREGTHDNAE